jgi:hypothetical protein
LTAGAGNWIHVGQTRRVASFGEAPAWTAESVFRHDSGIRDYRREGSYLLQRPTQKFAEKLLEKFLD